MTSPSINHKLAKNDSRDNATKAYLVVHCSRSHRQAVIDGPPARWSPRVLFMAPEHRAPLSADPTVVWVVGYGLWGGGVVFPVAKGATWQLDPVGKGAVSRSSQYCWYFCFTPGISSPALPAYRVGSFLFFSSPDGTHTKAKHEIYPLQKRPSIINQIPPPPNPLQPINQLAHRHNMRPDGARGQ